MVISDVKPFHLRSLHGKNTDFVKEVGIYIDQYLLSEVDFLIMSDSGYSEMAASQGFLGHDRVIHFDLYVSLSLDV